MEQERNRRYAYEQFVRDQDEWYWNRTKRLIDEKVEKTTTLTRASIVVSGIAIVISAFFLLRRSA